jgi:hypothetical protein
LHGVSTAPSASPVSSARGDSSRSAGMPRG